MPRITKPSTQARRRSDTASKRERVMAAAEAAFLEDGYTGATTDRIASLAGVSVGTVYNCGGSKEKLYAAVVEAVGRELVAYLEETVLPLRDPGTAIDLLVRYRLANFDRHRLLMALFSSDRGSGAQATPVGLADEPRRLYDRYLELVAHVFEIGMEQQVFERMQPRHLALTFEGILHAFVGYWMRPGQEESQEDPGTRIKEAFMKMAGTKPMSPTPDPDAIETRSRVVFVTSFDMSRLTELIAVARSFGSAENAAHLDELEAELGRSKVVAPTAVPRDVITMNSRIRVRQQPSEAMRTCGLVFPADAGRGDENVSILSPLGTALLGCRVGEAVESQIDGQPVRLTVTELLYQPEAAGDFHR